MAPNIWDGDEGAVQGSHLSMDNGVLKLMALEVEMCNRQNGWYDNSRTFGDDIALLHSEVSEALEAYRTHGTKRMVTDHATFPYSEVHTLNEDEPYPRQWRYVHKEGQQEPEKEYGPSKPEGVPSELADVLVRLLDMCSRYGVDLFAEWRSKMDYNWSRSYRHGGKAL